uniref:Integrase, catalytic region, zinc finger, CCHC-type, peptidase aspartic, catalytic n=1 Tax=Tanacetum cinerariifolium TaxID=118510 RepID=A0A6L2JM94_TANCI|nr:hypothetical protein [Tanacetum cinerariifolium]
MNNNIMADGSKVRPPMLSSGRYAQWQSCVLRYTDTRKNSDALRKCILEGSYKLTTLTIQTVPATDNSLELPEPTTVETLLNMSPENKEHYQLEKEAIHLLLIGIRDEICVTVDACKIAYDMWIAIERLQQGESLKIQDVKTNLFWVFGKFTSHYGESMESCYSGFYKMMNEMIRNNLTVAIMQNKLRKIRICKKNLALIAKYFKKIYKPTNNNPRTSSNSKNKNVDTSSRYKNDDQTRQFGNQRTVTVAAAIETECRKPKREKDYTYHKEWTLLCKQAEKCVLLQAEQADWLKDTDEEIDEQELEAHYSYMAKIQEVPTTDLGTDTEPLEKTDQNAKECDDERVALANLIANLTLDTKENKKILIRFKKANTSLTQELKECKSNLEESNTTGNSCLIALQNKQTELETYKTLNDHTVDYDKLEHKLNETQGLLAQKEIDIEEGLKLKAYEISVVK